jgi:hypothetical protein
VFAWRAAMDIVGALDRYPSGKLQEIRESVSSVADAEGSRGFNC